MRSREGFRVGSFDGRDNLVAWERLGSRSTAAPVRLESLTYEFRYTSTKIVDIVALLEMLEVGLVIGLCVHVP